MLKTWNRQWRIPLDISMESIKWNFSHSHVSSFQLILLSQKGPISDLAFYLQCFYFCDDGIREYEHNIMMNHSWLMSNLFMFHQFMSLLLEFDIVYRNILRLTLFS